MSQISGLNTIQPQSFVRYNKPEARPYVTVALDPEHGDFGPFTPGTKTSGIQEAINFVASLGGGIILVKNGKYNVSGRITLEPNVTLRGHGIGATVLNMQGNTLANDTTQPSYQSLALEDMTLNDVFINLVTPNIFQYTNYNNLAIRNVVVNNLNNLVGTAAVINGWYNVNLENVWMYIYWTGSGTDACGLGQNYYLSWEKGGIILQQGTIADGTNGIFSAIDWQGGVVSSAVGQNLGLYDQPLSVTSQYMANQHYRFREVTLVGGIDALSVYNPFWDAVFEDCVFTQVPQATRQLFGTVALQTGPSAPNGISITFKRCTFVNNFAGGTIIALVSTSPSNLMLESCDLIDVAGKATFVSANNTPPGTTIQGNNLRIINVAPASSSPVGSILHSDGNTHPSYNAIYRNVIYMQLNNTNVHAPGGGGTGFIEPSPTSTSTYMNLELDGLQVQLPSGVSSTYPFVLYNFYGNGTSPSQGGIIRAGPIRWDLAKFVPGAGLAAFTSTAQAFTLEHLINQNLPVVSANPPVSGTIYTNTFGHNIFVLIPVTLSPTASAGASASISVNGSTVQTVSAPAGASPQQQVLTATVPAFGTFSLSLTNATAAPAQLVRLPP